MTSNLNLLKVVQEHSVYVSAGVLAVGVAGVILTMSFCGRRAPPSQWNVIETRDGSIHIKPKNPKEVAGGSVWPC